MNKVLKKLLSAAAAGAVAASTAGAMVPAGAEQISAAEVVKEMGVGWNLGNSLDAHGNWASGLDTETCWGNPKTTKAMIDAVKAKGFNTIRVPVTWYKHMDSNYKVNGTWMARVKEVVNYGIDNDMYVILNCHHDEWNKPTNANYSAASKELTTLWQQVATEFKGYDKHLIFEGMNEPRNYGGTHEWDGGTAEMRNVINKLNKDFVDTVRATGGNNATRALMVPTYAASVEPVAMNAWVNPNNDPNVIVSIHAYTPYYFAYYSGYGEQKTFNSQMQSQLNDMFNNVNNIFLSKGQLAVIGEFSATNKSNTAERSKWAQAYASRAKELGIPIVLWDNGTITDEENPHECHGYLDRNAVSWYSESEPVVDTLISSYGLTVPDDPKPSTDEKRETVSSSTYTASGWEPSAVIKYNLSTMADGSYIAMTFDQSGTEPTLIVQDVIQYKVWAKVSPTKVVGNVAYFSKEDIAASYGPAFKSKYSRDTMFTLESAEQIFVSAENQGNCKVTKIEYVVPAKGLKGDIDLNGQLDYLDVDMMISFINMEVKLNDQQFSNAQITDDEDVTYEDLSCLIDMINGER